MQSVPLKRALRQEAESLRAFAAVQNNLQQAISRRQWTELNREIDALRRLADKIEMMEENRLQAFEALREALNAEPREGFTALAFRLPAEERDELIGLYRSLKAAVVRVKASAGLLSYYIGSMSDALRQIVEELFPHRKGRLYSRTGKTKEAGDESLMLYGNA